MMVKTSSSRTEYVVLEVELVPLGGGGSGAGGPFTSPAATGIASRTAKREANINLGIGRTPK